MHHAGSRLYGCSDEYLESGNVIDLRTGKAVLEGILIGFNPVADLVASYIQGTYVDEYGDEHVEVRALLQIHDLDSGDLVFEIDDEELSELEIQATYDERLWFIGPNGHDIVSPRTGERDTEYSPAPDGEANIVGIPVGAGESWVIVTNGENSEPLTLVRSSEGRLRIEDFPRY